MATIASTVTSSNSTNTPLSKVPTVTHLDIPAADTEVLFTFPAATVAYLLQIRMGGLVKYSWALGQSGIEYITLFRGVMLFKDFLDPTAALTLYVQSPVAGTRLDIEYWQ